MSKQTAVEWLVQEISSDRVGQAIIKTFLKEFEQAKAMEKEQIIEASHIMYMNGTTKYPITAEQYYNETYGGDK
jgi:predicted amino acid racemase